MASAFAVVYVCLSRINQFLVVFFKVHARGEGLHRVMQRGRRWALLAKNRFLPSVGITDFTEDVESRVIIVSQRLEDCSMLL